MNIRTRVLATAFLVFTLAAALDVASAQTRKPETTTTVPEALVEMLVGIR